MSEHISSALSFPFNKHHKTSPMNFSKICRAHAFCVEYSPDCVNKKCMLDILT